jgi:hypothetical protein
MNIEYAWNGLQAVQRSQEDLFFQVPIAVDLFTSQFFRQFISPSNERNYSLIIGAATYQWKFTIELPPDYQLGKHPLDVDLQNPAGSYKAIYAIDQGVLSIHRTLTLNDAVYPAEAYSNVADLLIAAIKDRDAIFSFTPAPVKKFPGIRS